MRRLRLPGERRDKGAKTEKKAKSSINQIETYYGQVSLTTRQYWL